MTIDIMLIKVDGTANNNKFYHVTCEDNTITKEWGRVGSTGQKSIVYGNDTQAKRLINAKKRKGYTEVDITTNSNHQLSQAASTLSTSTDPAVSSLINYLVKNNAHDISIASGGQINVTHGEVSTPLGMVTPTSITHGKNLLSDIASHRELHTLEEYLSVIPQKLRRGWQEDFLSTEKEIQEQYDFLDQLNAAVEVADLNNQTSVEEDLSDSFRYRIDIDDALTDMYQKRYSSSSQRKNHSDRVKNAKISHVYTISDTKGTEAFDKNARDLGNVKTLWHGSRSYNILSILSSGLRIPSRGAFNVTGAMFGPGIYFSETGSKSAGYGDGGFWVSGRGNRWYLLVADIVAGHEYRPNIHGLYPQWKDVHSGKVTDPKHKCAFNSVNVKAGTCGVYNHEAIIWNTDQIKMTHLIEFSS